MCGRSALQYHSQNNSLEQKKKKNSQQSLLYYDERILHIILNIYVLHLFSVMRNVGKC